MVAAVATKAFVGKVYIAIGDGESPESFVRYCEVNTIGGFGEKNDQIDATTFCSGGYKEFIAGLSEGQEIGITANYSLDDDVQEQLIDAVQAKSNIHVQVQVGDDSPQKGFGMTVAMLSWEIDPAVDNKNEIKFSMKVTGQIQRTIP